ncbi:MAG: PhoH family protein [Peptococcaceae bacterium]
MKTYVLTESVLLQSPGAIFVFDDNEVVIPEVVIQQLAKFKNIKTDEGANARQLARELDELRQCGCLTQGVPLKNGGILKVEMNHHSVKLPPNWNPKDPDIRALQVCLALKQEHKQVALVTRDVFQRIQATSVGIEAQEFLNERIEQHYTGRTTVACIPSLIDTFYKQGFLNLSQLSREMAVNLELIKNQFVILKAPEGLSGSALTRFDGEKFVSLKYANDTPYGIKPQTVGQRFAIEALMTPPEEAPLCIIKGVAGSGKTLLALAAGLSYVMTHTPNPRYRRILVCRPNVTMDEELGYLPGTEQEKISPLLRPIKDNLEILVDSDENERYKNENKLADKVEELFNRRLIAAEAINFLRGRSLVKHFLIIDEAQNLTPGRIKGIITRAGKGTKVVLLGDPSQVDHPYLDQRSNGLVYAAENMKGSPLCYQVSLEEHECERSPLALEGALRL